MKNTFFALLLSITTAQAHEISFTGPCDSKPILAKEYNLPAANVGELTVKFLTKHKIAFDGNERGLHTVFQTPVGNEALEVISDTEMRAYGWCYFVNDLGPDVFPDEYPLDEGPAKIEWIFGFAHYKNGKWLLPRLSLHPDLHNATFEMLLAHRSGLVSDGPGTFPNNWLYLNLQTTKLTPTAARNYYASTILQLKPRTVPGTTFTYHNGGYMIAALILEELSGKSWETLIQEKLFAPLDMRSCGTGPTWGHFSSGTKVTPQFADNPPAFNPASGVHCSLGDWNKFLQEHLKGLRKEAGIVSVESFEKLHTVAANDGQNYTFGGWVKLERSWADGPVLWHNGSNTWNYAQVFIAPQKNAIVMSATNVGGQLAEDATSDAIAEVVKTKL